MPITIHTSNRMEILLEHLAEILKEPAGSVLAQETIVVQSRGMERWISMELAKKFGMWGNSAFPFPNKFIWDLFTSTMPDVHKSDCFDREILTWRIITALDLVLDTPAFKELQTYLAGHSRGLKLYQLAGKIADTFDQYTLYRGDILERWESGADSDWQAILWRALAGEGMGDHRARVKIEFLTRLAGGQIDTTRFPKRILIYGLSYMPSFHMDVLAGVASFTDVHIFALSPCREYWGDIMAAKSRAKYSAELNAVTEEGNALLASLGGLGRNFSNLILDCGAPFGPEHDEYVESTDHTLLASLQNNILNLVNADPENKIEIAADDRSISVHACHSPMREVEVLHDQLLDMFSTIDGLAPRDIIVMTPDIETYSPYITAVFSGGQDPKRRIPFSIADRTMSNEGRVAETLMAILRLPGGRFTGPEVVNILSSAPVSSFFGISADDHDLIKDWLDETHIRWGMSEDDRTSIGLPAYSEGSWMAGLERLVFGYAMSSDDLHLFDGVLPFDNMEGDTTAVLGHFVTFVTSLHALAGDLDRPRTLAQWRETLCTLLQNFFKPSDADAREYISIGNIIDSLGNIETMSGYCQDVGLDVMRSWLQERFDNEGAGVGFLSGKVTFCAMLPMRSIPVKVVALVGMNDGSFPRQSRSPGFDLIPAKPRPGDRSLRDEDRYLFLEGLLSARTRLYISYTGLSIRDNSVVPPSVLVSELLDYLDQGYRRGDGAFHHSLMSLHRLQPFSAAYFNGQHPELFSFSGENLNAAKELKRAGHERPQFFHGALTPPDELFREIRIVDFLKFFENPAAFILRHRLGITAEQEVSPLEEREMFELDTLEEYIIKKNLLPHMLKGKSAPELLPVVRARGILPPAGVGDALFEKLSSQVAGFADQVRAIMAGREPLPSLDIDLTIGAFRLYGRLADIMPGHLLRYRCSKLSAKDQVTLWIEHLILNHSGPDEYPKQSTLIMIDGAVTVRPVTESRECLELLLDHYWQGLMVPLHFFPRSSLAYAESGKIKSAESIWNNERYPESKTPGCELCFGAENPLDAAFEEVASDVFATYLDHREEQ